MPDLRTSDGTRLHYEVHGSGATELILLHGMGGAASAWRAVVPHLDPGRFRAVALDFRGHGRSGGDPASFSFPQFNADILAVAAAVGMTSATVVGFSGGTKCAVWLAAQAPQLVQRLVLVAPPGLGIAPMPREMMWPFFDELTRTKSAPAEFDAWLTEKLGEHRAAVVGDYANTPLAVLRATAEMWFYTSVEDRAQRVTQPVLVVAGAREPLGNAEFQRQTTLVSCPHARLSMLDCGHWISLEEPVRLADLIAGWCSVATATTPSLPGFRAV